MRRPDGWHFMDRFEVPDYDHPEQTYLTRYKVIQTPWFGIYVHRFDTPDARPTLHDHPWSFVSFVLRGGYDEVTDYDLAPRSVRRINVKRAEGRHYISRLHRTPTWTLMLVGRRRREWGYIDQDGTWTRFDLHPHADEFDRAIAARKEQDAIKQLRQKAAEAWADRRHPCRRGCLFVVFPGECAQPGCNGTLPIPGVSDDST